MSNRSEFQKVILECLAEVKKMKKEYPPKIEKSFNRIGNSVISKWYSTYDPRIYHRVGSLYKAFKVTVTEDKFSVDFDKKYMNEFFHHHQDNSIIFNNSFIGGYHGGSRGMIGGEIGSAVPMWREPMPFYTEWGDEAPRSFSPYQEMYKRMSKKTKEIERELRRKEDQLINKLSPYLK